MHHVTATGRLAVVCSALLLLLAPAAWAVEYVADFESSNPFSAGTLVGDQAASGAQSLYLAAGDLATLDIPAALLGRDIVVTMMVFDQGRWIDRTVAGYPTSVYGPRWGVSGLDGTLARIDCAATIIEKTFLTSENGYGFSGAAGTESRTGNWYSPQWFGGPRQCTLSADGGSNPGSGWVMGTPGTGRWTRWTFTVAASGEVTLRMAGSATTRTHNLGGSADQLWLFGGRAHATAGLPLAGVWIDDVRIWAADPLPLDSTVDFEGANSNPFSGGTVSTTYAASGTQSLYLGPGEEAFLPLDIPGGYVGDGIQVTMAVFDLGKWIDQAVTGYPTSCYGPRWGVSGGGSDAAISIFETQFLASGAGYGYAVEPRFDPVWYTYGFYGGPRQCTLSLNGGTNDGGGWVMGTEGTGAWTTWTFQIDRATNEVACARDGGTIVGISAGLAGAVDEIWMWGGGTDATAGVPLAGVYIDDVTVSAYSSTLEITAALPAGEDWVYQNTDVVTQNRHKAVVTVELTGGEVAGNVYKVTALAEDGGAVTNFQVPALPITLSGATEVIDILGGNRDTTTASSVGNPFYVIEVTVTGYEADGVTPNGQVATAEVNLTLRPLADINGDSTVDTTDKLEMNRYLNGIATAATFRELDLTGDGTTVDTSDKLQVNRVLNGIAVP